jgi:hypothetical protein
MATMGGLLKKDVKLALVQLASGVSSLLLYLFLYESKPLSPSRLLILI